MRTYREVAWFQLLDEYPEIAEQLGYNVELQLQQLQGEQLPKNTVAPVLQQLINNN